MTVATKDTMFSTRQVPWMKLGELVDTPVTAAEAAKLGGIDFDVTEQPVYFSVKEDGKPPRFVKVDDRKAIVRKGTNEWLSIVSKDYPVVQYSEAFDFMDSISPKFVAAGALRGGRQGFMVVSMPGLEDLENIDPHKMFAVLRTSHDCTRAVEVMVMPLRGKCMNQLTLKSFRAKVDHRWSVTHTGDVKSKLSAAISTAQRVSEYTAAYSTNVEKLVDIKVSDENAENILMRVLPDRPKRQDQVTSILSAWHHRPETVGFSGTGWGLVNAVSEYFEWDRKGGSSESRFLAALQGQTHQAINKTAGLLMSRV